MWNALGEYLISMYTHDCSEMFFVHMYNILYLKTG